MSRVTRRLFAAIYAGLMLLSLCGCNFSLNLKNLAYADESEVTETQDTSFSPVGAITWATEGVGAVDNAEDLNARVDEVFQAASEEGVAVEYKNEAFSTDGVNFECYIGNPRKSSYPLFITIYADTSFEEELFVSGLIKPGQAFNRVVMSRPLTEEVNTLPVCYTQVYEPHTGNNDTDDFTIRAQTVITINFNVVDPSFHWDLSGD